MLITRIELENIKSYRHVIINLRRGTTAISGANGAGKTTLVEAIGFALFDYLPYNRNQFIREGEKYGKVTVHLIGSDDRPYIVERRCGPGAFWTVFDEEANMRMEQTQDVQDKLHDLFGIDRERPLDSLFSDALGVPQGTFTAVFLESASKRKQTFDALLQIEDYDIAAKNLLETQHVYDKQMQEQQVKIQGLEFETRNLEEWRDQLKQARQLDEEQKQQNAQWNQQYAISEQQASKLSEQQKHLQQLQRLFEQREQDYSHRRSLLMVAELQMQAAQKAREIVTASEADYQSHEQARKRLQGLYQQQNQRNHLQRQQGQSQTELKQAEERAKSWQRNLDDVAQARNRVVELAPLVEQQIELERQRDEASRRKARYETIMDEGKKRRVEWDKNQDAQKKVQQQIKEIEPLQALADQLQERNDAVTQLRIKLEGRNEKRLHLLDKQNLLQDKQNEREKASADLDELEDKIEQIETHRREAEEMPILRIQLEELVAQQNRLEGNIEGYKKSRLQSAGGQCPLLHEPCGNLKKHGVTSLEYYFDNLLKDEHIRLATVTQAQQEVDGRILLIKPYADAFNNLGLQEEKRNNFVLRLKSIAIEYSRLEREVAELKQELETLSQLEPRLKLAEVALAESKQADQKVRKLDGLRREYSQLQERAGELDRELQERREAIKELSGSPEQLIACETALKTLGDPRSQSQGQLQIIEKEAYYLQQLRHEQQRQVEIQQQIELLEQKLTIYNTLDQQIIEQEALALTTETGAQNYLRNIREALKLPELETDWRRHSAETTQAEQVFQEAKENYERADAAFDVRELEHAQAEQKRLHDALIELAQQMQRGQERINELRQKIEQAEALKVELDAAQKEYQQLTDLRNMLDYFRKLIKDAAPYVLKAMLSDISAEANRIFGEIMGDRSAQLTWLSEVKQEYEIVLRRQGVARTFAQLSGGEQMSAALAVRLALLKKLSTLNLAFFDEPTQNMDELRRTNLAEQIKRVRGFDQLIVISHDDTFEQGLDSLLRLSKEYSETRLIGDDGDSDTEAQEVTPQALM
jgi:exonuclease SbcC